MKLNIFYALREKMRCSTTTLATSTYRLMSTNHSSRSAVKFRNRLRNCLFVRFKTTGFKSSLKYGDSVKHTHGRHHTSGAFPLVLAGVVLVLSPLSLLWFFF